MATRYRVDRAFPPNFSLPPRPAGWRRRPARRSEGHPRSPRGRAEGRACGAAASRRASCRAIPRRTRSRSGPGCGRGGERHGRARGGARPRLSQRRGARAGRHLPEGRHAVKARIAGLSPHEQYWYRFSTRGEESPVGRFRTALPPDSRQPVRFAFFSCQDFAFGYFHAHKLLAQGGPGLRGQPRGLRLRGGVVRARRRFAACAATRSATRRRSRGTGRSTRSTAPSERCAGARALPDDLDLGRPRGGNNYAGGAGPTGGLPPDERYTEARKAAAYRAYFESMPTFAVKPGGTRIYRAIRFGRTVDLILLDQRQYRADQPCGDPQLGPRAPSSSSRAPSSAGSSSPG